MELLFPVLPEDLKGLSDEELASLLQEHSSAAELINADDEDFLKGMEANEVIAQYEKGVNQINLLRAETKEREAAHAAYQARKNELAAEVKGEEEEAPAPEEPEGDEEEDAAEVVAEETDEPVEERELVLASAEPETVAETSTGTAGNTVEAQVRFSRTPPAPKPDRLPVVEEVKGAALVAAGELSLGNTTPLDSESLARMVIDTAVHHGPMPKIHPPGQFRFGGPEHKIARATFEFPEERTLTGDPDSNSAKLREVIVAAIPGGVGRYSLTASGGLCAPAEPFYSMVNFASQAEPVWDMLPVFAARRGAVNIPESTVIGDITSAISSISEANDALGGTYATKSCQDLTCPDYAETAVNIIAHCREYGNLNARSWPEKIAHENELTMAALAQTSEMFILERIKALSVNVTSGAETLGALIYLLDAITKSQYGIRGRLRMPREARFRALLPAVVLDILLLDAIQNQFDRYQTRADIDAFLRSTGIDPVYYIDGQFAAGDDQTPDATQAAAALDAFPDTIQWALFPEGAFLGIDMGVLELGVVRDSVLNSTNDFQVFGERFRNVARIAPQQACYWETTDICANGNFPPAGTTRTCD
jgi:hypothetical protein